MSKKTSTRRRPAPEANVMMTKAVFLILQINKQRGYDAYIHISKNLIEFSATGKEKQVDIYIKTTAKTAVSQLTKAITELEEMIEKGKR